MNIDSYRIDDCIIRISSEFGCNLYSWVIAGEEILYCPPGVPGPGAQFFAGGNPVLFPAVGRTWDRSGDTPVADRYRIAGMEEPFTMPCHGVVPFGAWNKGLELVTDTSVQVDYTFEVPENVFDEHYPFNISFALRFIFSGRRIAFEAAFQNQGTSPAPMAFGLHPYFRFLGEERLDVDLPCAYQMVLEPELLVPIGTEPLTSSRLVIANTDSCDMGYTGPTGRRATMRYPASGRTLHIDCDENIEVFVTYSDGSGEYLCLEPWTRGCGMFENLGGAGWEERVQLIVLEPNEARTVSLAYSVAE